MRRNINPDEYPHNFNVILETYGVRSLIDLAKGTQSVGILERLAEESWKDSKICKYVAKNFVTSKETIRKLSKHNAECVRIGVAERKDLELAIAFKLAFDPSINVRMSLSRGTQYDCIKKFLLRYNYENDIIVRNILIKPENRDLILEFIEDGDQSIITALLECTELNAEYLKAIIEAQLKNSNFHFVKKVLEHKKCTAELGNFIISNFSLAQLNAKEIEAIKNL